MANYRLEGPDGVLSLLKYLERKMLGRTPKTLSRASSILSVETAGIKPKNRQIEVQSIKRFKEKKVDILPKYTVRVGHFEKIWLIFRAIFGSL